ncbi:MAG: sugar phosphate isomerase/epimerase [Caldilineaceae bacterium]|nr:sugar phosphate isomerase/epimerase [Caldilineaceae bacterium]
MHLGFVTNPRQSLAAEITWAADHGLALLDLALEAPAAAPESVKWAEVKAAIADRGLQVVGRAATYLPLDNPAPLVRQAALDECRRAVDAAAAVGATLCTVRFCGWPAHLEERTGYEYYRQLLEMLLKHAQAQGVAVALENSPQNLHQLKYFREIFQRVPALKLAYHMGHGNVQTMQSMTREYFFALADRLAHIRISDNDGHHNLYLPLGAVNGGLNCVRELQTVRSFQYDGTIALEIQGDRRWLLGSAQRLTELWSQAG